MRKHGLRETIRRTVFIFITLFSTSVMAVDAPPPQGPPQAPSGEWPEVNIFSMNTLRWFLWDGAEEAMYDHNQSSEHKLSWASGAQPPSCGYDCLSAPHMSATYHIDRPNDRVVRLHGEFVFDLDVNNYPFDRRIITPFEVTVSCRGWRDGSGKITITTKTHAPYSPDGDWSWLEEIIGWGTPFFLLPRYIDARVDAELGGEGPAKEGHLTPCRSLGVNHTPGQSDGDAVTWESPLRRLPTLPLNTGTVIVDSITRNNTSSTVDTSEGVSFELFVNGTVLRIPQDGEIHIASGETLHLFDSNVAVNLDEAESLQVIVRDVLGGSGWHAFDRQIGFGQGTHTLTTHRTELVPVGSGGYGTGFGQGDYKPTTLSIREFDIAYSIYAGSRVTDVDISGEIDNDPPSPTTVYPLEYEQDDPSFRARRHPVIE